MCFKGLVSYGTNFGSVILWVSIRPITYTQFVLKLAVPDEKILGPRIFFFFFAMKPCLLSSVIISEPRYYYFLVWNFSIREVVDYFRLASHVRYTVLIIASANLF